MVNPASWQNRNQKKRNHEKGENGRRRVGETRLPVLEWGAGWEEDNNGIYRVGRSRMRKGRYGDPNVNVFLFGCRCIFST